MRLRQKNRCRFRRVLYKGEPAKDVAVLFEPKSDATYVPHSKLAVTDASGRFSIFSTEQRRKKGIEPGECVVYLGWNNPDAVEISDSVPSPDDPKPTPSPYRFPGVIGRRNDDSVTNSFNRAFDEFRIYDRPLSPREISGIVEATF